MFKKKWFDRHKGIPTRPGMLYNEFCIACIVHHHSCWQTEGGMLRDSIISPHPDPASVSSIFRLHHYLFRTDSSSVMGLITPLLCEAADGCTTLRRVREKPCWPTPGHSYRPAGSFSTAQGIDHWGRCVDSTSPKPFQSINVQFGNTKKFVCHCYTLHLSKESFLFIFLFCFFLFLWCWYLQFINMK